MRQIKFLEFVLLLVYCGLCDDMNVVRLIGEAHMQKRIIINYTLYIMHMQLLQLYALLLVTDLLPFD